MTTITLDKLTGALMEAQKPAIDRQEALLKALEAKLTPKDDEDKDEDKDTRPISMAQFNNLVLGVKEGKILEPNGKKVTLEDLEQSVLMEQRGLGGLVTDLDKAVRGLPLGSALIGGFSALFASEIIDGFVGRQNPMVNAAVKAGTVLFAGAFGRRFIGTTAFNVFAGLMVFEILRDFLPINQWVSQLTGAFGGRMGLQTYNGYQQLDGGFSAANVIPAHHGVQTQFDAIYN